MVYLYPESESSNCESLVADLFQKAQEMKLSSIFFILKVYFPFESIWKNISLFIDQLYGIFKFIRMLIDNIHYQKNAKIRTYS